MNQNHKKTRFIFDNHAYPHVWQTSGGVLTAQTVAAYRRNQPLFLVMPQRRRRDSAQARHRADIQFFCH